MNQEPEATGISIRDLRIRYGDNAPVVDIPELLLPANGYTLITGPTGCGKSTLALALVGLAEEMVDATLSGSIRIDGVDTSALEPAERAVLVGAVWQRPDAQLFRRGLIDEVQAGLDFHLAPAQEGTARARIALEQFGLSHLDEQRDPLALSGGEQQRLALTAVLSLEPRLLVLDEAFSQLDHVAKSGLADTIADLRLRRQVTVIAFDHRPDPHLDAADRVIVLDGNGRIVLDGSPRHVYSDNAERCREIGVRCPASASRAPRRNKPRVERPEPEGADLRIESLSVERRGTTVLEQIDLALPQGSIAVLTGPNGAGKSSLLSALAGTRRKTDGRISPSRRQRLSAGVGYAPQRGSELMLARTVREELRLALPPKGSLPDEELAEMLEEAGLLGLADRHPQRLSGGQRQRLATLLATSGRPALLLLDEPTNAQDARGLERIRALVSRHCAERISIIATHEADALDGLTTHRIVLEDGRLTEAMAL